MTNQYPPNQQAGSGYVPPSAHVPPEPMPHYYRPIRRSRPPLTPGQKSAAMWAGAVGFPLMSLGFAIIFTLLSWSAVAGIIRGVASQMNDQSAETLQVISDLDAMWENYWWAFALALLVGVVIWILGYGASIGIAHIGKVAKATGTTWAGLGIASVAGFIVLWLGYIIYIVGLIAVLALDGDTAGAGFVIFNVAALVLGIVIWALVGALSWWWMAHCLRARHPAQRYAGEPYYI